MTRTTSIETYMTIAATGLLSKRQFSVYRALCLLGPLTANEVHRELLKLKPKIFQHSVTPRFAELKARGVIEEAGERVCSVSGQNCITWQTTDNLPAEPPKKRPRLPRADLEARVERLLSENAKLRAELNSLQNGTYPPLNQEKFPF